MKKLRLFDSLKFVVAAIVCTFILNVAHADTSINSVIAYGKTEQSGTPTPTNPVPIMTNNGVLKVSPNLFDKAQTPYQSGNFISSATVGQTGFSVTSYANYNVYRIEVQPNTTYTFGKIKANAPHWVVADSSDKVLQTAQNNGGTEGVYITITTATSAKYLYLSVAVNGTYKCDDILQLAQGSTATTGIYADGLTETIRDSAGHTATAQMLLGLNDTYRDEQDITTGAITRKVGVKVLDGTGTWASSSTYGATVYLQSAASNEFSPAAAKEKIISNYFVGEGVASTSTTHSENTCFFNTTGHLYFRTSKTPAEFKQWLADQYAAGTPVIVVYPLATETTEPNAVAPQTLNTAPVRQTAGSILGMPIEVILSDNTSQWVTDAITIATTRYNEQQFAPVQNELSNAMNVVDDVVTRTMTQAQAIDTIATTKQTRPAESCPVGKNCLLVEDENGTPHWYVIAGADEANPSTNP